MSRSTSQRTEKVGKGFSDKDSKTRNSHRRSESNARSKTTKERRLDGANFSMLMVRLHVGAKEAARWIPGAAGGTKDLLVSGNDPGVPVTGNYSEMFQRQREALSALNEAVLRARSRDGAQEEVQSIGRSHQRRRHQMKGLNDQLAHKKQSAEGSGIPGSGGRGTWVCCMCAGHSGRLCLEPS